MELFDVLRELNLLSVKDSQYYLGTIILCLEYLHSKNIVYRDLKPENIMIDSNGVLYLIDLGTCKLLEKSKNAGRTFTIIGTPHYMAPEIIQGKGYSFSVDYWSLGIVLYEFMCGNLPYGEDAGDPYEIYEEIIKTKLRFPPFIKNKTTINFISQLLSKVPEVRLGGSFAALKANKWFDNFSWDDLFAKTLDPPYIPDKDKIINSQEIQKKIAQGQMVTNVIKQDQKEAGLNYNKVVAQDPNWDKDF